VAELAGELDDRDVLLADAQGREGVAQVVRPRRAEAQSLGRLVKAAVSPVVVVVPLPNGVVGAAEDEAAAGRQVFG
jgi:hypothetical protein